MNSKRFWKLAQSPNYIKNIDKKYAYSEVPYIGEYNLVKLPSDVNLIEHVDFWGEGRLETSQGVSGFSNCYNVNHHYQLVSNGPDKDKKIPNRIPVINYTNCDTSPYVCDNSVKIVTVMGAPINKSCAKDIARMINEIQGKVIVYGFDENSADVKNLDENLLQKNLIFCPGYNLPEYLSGLTLFNTHRSYLNLSQLAEILYNNIVDGNIDDAVAITENCIRSENVNLIIDTIDKLLQNGNKNIMIYAYKLWRTDKNTLNNFPAPFKNIFDGDNVKIISKPQGQPLKLSAEIDSSGNRVAWGDGEESPKDQLVWKFIPDAEKNIIQFEIQNIEYGLKLKLDTKADEYGDKLCLGSNTNDNDLDFKFRLEPIKKDGEIVFSIFHQKTGQSLKLDVNTDVRGNRKLCGNDYFVVGDYDRFGWYVVPDK